MEIYQIKSGERVFNVFVHITNVAGCYQINTVGSDNYEPCLNLNRRTLKLTERNLKTSKTLSKPPTKLIRRDIAFTSVRPATPVLIFAAVRTFSNVNLLIQPTIRPVFVYSPLYVNVSLKCELFIPSLNLCP